MRSPLRLVCLSLLLFLTTLGAAIEARAHVGDSLGASVIHACVSRIGIVRVVGVAGSCVFQETPLHWAIQGPVGPAGPPGGFTGVKAFSSTDVFVVPQGITRLMVDAWGAGGGGGAGGTTLPSTGGGGGGGGGYVRGIVAVVPGLAYAIAVGEGGSPGQPGGDTALMDPNGGVLISAAGGAAGDTSNGGAGGQGNPNGGILIPGTDGSIGFSGGCFETPEGTSCVPGSEGRGGVAVDAPPHAPIGFGGFGGRGAGIGVSGPPPTSTPIPATPGDLGRSGYLIIQF